MLARQDKGQAADVAQTLSCEKDQGRNYWDYTHQLHYSIASRARPNSFISMVFFIFIIVDINFTPIFNYRGF